jgi:hypothetical protein
MDIMAERTSISGENELLVMWKPSWVPLSHVAEGDILDRFKSEDKMKYVHSSSNMRVMIPVEPGTTLAADCSIVKDRARNRDRGLTITAHFNSADSDATGSSSVICSATKRTHEPSIADNTHTKTPNSNTTVSPTPQN